MLKEGDVLLRPLEAKDKEALCSLANNKKVADNLRDAFPHPYKETDADFFIGLSQVSNPPTIFGIEYKGRFCGVIGLTGQDDVYRKTAEIGYWIGQPYWNKGIATIAVKLMTQYGFDKLNFTRIHTGIFEYNTASMRVLDKNGYEKEGVFRKSVFKNGEFWDEYRYARLK